MNLRSLKALRWGVLFFAVLAGCASTPKKPHHKPAPTPAERLALKHYKLGIDAYANTRYSEAITHWKATLANDPTDATSLTPNAAAYIGRAEMMIKATKSASPVPTKEP